MLLQELGNVVWTVAMSKRNIRRKCLLPGLLLKHNYIDRRFIPKVPLGATLSCAPAR